METTAPVVRFVKCPKCLKILTEFAEVPVYKCGGCGVILRAKSHSISGRNLSTISANPASQNLTGIDPPSNESLNIGERTDPNVSNSNGEIISMEKSLEHEQTETNEVPDPEDNEELEQSVEVNPKSSVKSSESSETMEHSTGSEEDMIKMEFANGGHFRMNTRISTRAYDGSASSTDEDGKDHIPRKFFLSRRTFRNKYASDSLDSTEAGENYIPVDISQAPFRSSKSPTEDAKGKTNHKFSKEEDQVNILHKVDELRNELRGLFNETANGEEFKRKFLPKEYRPSLVPLARHHTSHFSTINQRTQDLQIKTSRRRSMVSLCRPVSGGAPFVICYECLKLLHLPADFLVSPKKVHKLQCGACSQVLLFSFKPRSRSIPPTPKEEFQLPPTEENENSLSRSEETTPWHRNSTSDDSYISLHKSNSGEVEAAMNKPRSFDDEIVEEEQGEGRDMSGSRLHSLLGYSSARDMLFNSDYSYDGNQSTYSDTPSFYRPYGRRRWEKH